MDVFNLYAKLSLNTDDYEKGVEKAKSGASSLMDVFSGTLLGNVVSDGLRTVANGITEIGKTAANMAVSIGKASLDSYADYEQLVGGVETLYKDSAGIIENYAKDAYKNVGLSANDYMETSTSFAAALVSSLSGDTEKAAEMANTAISDMSDNANKMGTNISSIQDAYNGFAKQNYTMLDNLKLGYGGTQAEMKRLIKEAAAMKDTQKELGVTVDATSMSYANIVQAIHVVQANMGIMGTTSKEAATTIQGSTASMKSAWENLLTGIADPEQDFQTLVDNLVDSVITAGNNIIPRIKEIVPTLIDGLSELVTQLAPYISGVIMELEPTIEEGLQALFGGLSSVASELQPIVADVFSFFGDAIISGLTSAIENSDFSFLLDIFDNVKTAAEEVLPVIAAVGSAVGVVYANIKAMQIAKGIAKLAAHVQGFFAFLAANPLVAIVAAIASIIAYLVTLYNTNEEFRNAVQPFLDSVVEMVQNIWTKIQEFGAWVQPYVQAVIEFIITTVQNIIATVTPVMESVGAAFSAAFQVVQTIWGGLEPLFSGILGVILAAVGGAAKNIGAAFQLAWTLVSSVWSNATSFFSTIFDTIAGIFSAIKAVLHGDFSAAWEAIKGVLSSWGDYFQGLMDNLKNIFSGIGQFFMDVGKNIVEGIKNGISAAWEGFKGFVSNLWEGVKGIFHIGAGDVTVDGGEVSGSHAGGLDYVPYNNYVANLHRGEMVLTADEAAAYRKGEANTAGGMTFNIDINGIQFEDVNSMAHALVNQISYELQAQSNRKAAVYA